MKDLQEENNEDNKHSVLEDFPVNYKIAHNPNRHPELDSGSPLPSHFFESPLTSSGQALRMTSLFGLSVISY